MLKKTPLLLCCIWLLLLPGLAFADDSSTFARLYHSDEPILTVLTAQEGTVLAVVDEFPILERMWILPLHSLKSSASPARKKKFSTVCLKIVLSTRRRGRWGFCPQMKKWTPLWNSSIPL